MIHIADGLHHCLWRLLGGGGESGLGDYGCGKMCQGGSDGSAADVNAKDQAILVVIEGGQWK